MALECDPYFRSRELGGAACGWRLGGRSDALLADCSGVVEVKNRVGRLLGHIRTGDRVQLQVGWAGPAFWVLAFRESLQAAVEMLLVNVCISRFLWLSLLKLGTPGGHRSPCSRLLFIVGSSSPAVLVHMPPCQQFCLQHPARTKSPGPAASSCPPAKPLPAALAPTHLARSAGCPLCCRPTCG